MHRIILYQKSGSRDITRLCSDAELTDELTSICRTFSCTVLRNDKTDKYAHWPGIVPGDKLRVTGEAGELFSGTILTVGQDGAISAMDPGWNLSRSEIILQLDRAAAADAVGRMGAKAGVPAGKLELPPTQISKVWWGETAEGILQEILDICSAETGKRYRRRVRAGKLEVTEWPTEARSLRYRDQAQGPVDPTLAKGPISGSDSVEELINAIVLTDKERKSRHILGSARNEASIQAFGLLQKVETLAGDETAAQARQRLRTMLAQEDRVRKERTVEILGDDSVESGDLIRFVPNRYDVSGDLRVLQVVHHLGPIHTMTLTLQLPEPRAAGSGDTVTA